MSLLVVSGIEKHFREFSAEWRRVANCLGLPFKPVAQTTVLAGISFGIGAGEAVGIVGQNGAGKSTLLKIITGTLAPSAGSVVLSGRIAAILELGMGFNPELTGRQNVFHAASIMGFGHAEVEAAMPDIEAFAEIGNYFDEPVRVYSSGMQVRVAFAVATAWRPEILIVDEALSVGDSYFQHKSFNRIREFQQQGTSLLIVSHDRSAIQALCSRAILLEKGEVMRDGDPQEVMDFYNALIAEKENRTVEVRRLNSGQAQTSSGSGEARVTNIRLCNASGEVADHIKVGEAVTLTIQIMIHQPIPSLVLGFALRDRLGQVMFGSNTFYTDQVIDAPVVGRSYEFTVGFEANLGVGSYSVVTALHSGDSHVTNNYEWRDMALVFNVVNVNKTAFQGSVWLDASITHREPAA